MWLGVWLTRFFRCSILRSCGGRDSVGWGGGRGGGSVWTVGVGGEGVWLTQFVVTEVNVLHSRQLDKQLGTKKRKFMNRYLLNFSAWIHNYSSKPNNHYPWQIHVCTRQIN